MKIYPNFLVLCLLLLFGAVQISNAQNTNDEYLSPDETLAPGKQIFSKNGYFRATMQHDGNFVIYCNGQALWATNTAGKGPGTLIMQQDGNLVIYAQGRPIWASNTAGKGKSTLMLTGEGQLIIYATNGATWASPKIPVDLRNVVRPNDAFVMAFASDPQLGYEPYPIEWERGTAQSEKDQYLRDHYYYKNMQGSSETGNLWHSASIVTLKKQVIVSGKKWKGVVINGDMTNTIDDDYEVPDYEKYYSKKFLVYPGLGNHEFQYSDKWCSERGYATAEGLCAKLVYDDFVQTVIKIPNLRSFDYYTTKWDRKGSRAYSWDIGNYHFIQLNNNPAFTHTQSVYNSLRVGTENYVFTSSMEWLKKDLEANKGRKIIINMHGMSTDDSSIQVSDNFGPILYPKEWTAFKRLLDSHPNVVAIFAGHIHNWIGQMKAYWNTSTNKMDYTNENRNWTITTTPSGRKIDVFFCGGAEWAHYLKVSFHPNKLVVEPIHSANGYVIPTNNQKTWTVNH